MSYSSDKSATRKKKGADLEDIHAEAVKRYDRGYLKDQENIEAAYSDLRFCTGDGQWDDSARRNRDAEGRPILIVDQTSQFVRQVTGDMRQLRPAIKVVPVDDRGDRNVAAKIMPGMIRYIEQRSDASAAYFNGIDSQVRAGIGHWRVVTEYSGRDTFLQELAIEGIEDGIGVVWDPDSTRPTREDADWCFVPVNISREKFEERWPDKSPSAFGNVPASFVGWTTEDHVRIAEYWVKKPAKLRLAFLPTGGVDDVTDDPEGEAEAVAQGAVVEERDDFSVCRYLISQGDVLEGPEEWPGRYIPIVPVIGEEIKIGDRIVRRGVIRVLQEPQRIYNYTMSAQVEVMALQPKAPWLGTQKQFEEFVDQWETANSKNWPFLMYTPDDKAGGAPSRVGPPVSSQGLNELLATARNDMSTVTGIYPSALGAASNETSGRAIVARQREGDTGTFHYTDNFARALRHTGRILIDLIPHIYDTQRTIRILGEDGKVDLMQINQATLAGDGTSQMMLNDVTVGAYDVSVEMGPSYNTKREEARDGMQTLMQSAGPEVAQLFIDLFAKMQDWPLADKIAKRAQMILPPNIQAAEAQESGEQPPAPPQTPPTPEQQMQMQAAQLELQNKDLANKKLQADIAKIVSEIQGAGGQPDQAGNQEAMGKLQLEHQKMLADMDKFEKDLALKAQLGAAEIQIKNEELDIKRAELHIRSAEAQAKTNMAQANQQHEVGE